MESRPEEAFSLLEIIEAVEQIAAEDIPLLVATQRRALLEEVERRLLGLKGSGWVRFRQLAADVPATDRSLRELLDAQYVRGA